MAHVLTDRSMATIVAGLTMAFVAALISPHAVLAAGAGDLIKCKDNAAVYLLAEDGKRYAFPNEKIYSTWNADFKDVKEITCEDLAKLALGGVVKYRAGVRLVKIPSVPTVYAVESDGVLRPIRNEAQARALYGEGWSAKVDDLSEAFFPRYRLGKILEEKELPEGMILEDDDGGLTQVDDDGKLVSVEDTLSEKEKALLRRAANRVRHVEARLGHALSRIAKLEAEIERLQRQLQRQRAVEVNSGETKSVTVKEVKEKKSTAPSNGLTGTKQDDKGALPDMTVTDISASSSGAITATVANKGKADAQSHMGVYFWLDDVLEWTYSTSTLADQSLLKAGDSSKISPQKIMGTRTVKVCVDPLNVVVESDETNNCRTETLTAKDGTFTLTVTGVDAIDALGKKDERYRSFGFQTTAPLDHYRIRIWDKGGKLHDEFVHQIVNAGTVTSYYVSPSWLTPLQYNMSYTYEVHAEEYGTGDAADASGSFTTGSNTASGTTLSASRSSASPSGKATVGITDALVFTLTAGASSPAHVSQMVFKINTSDNEVTGWNNCGDGNGKAVFADATRFTLKNSVGQSIGQKMSFYDATGLACTNEARDLGWIYVTVDETITAGATATYTLSVNVKGASAAQDDTLRVDVEASDDFLWNNGVTSQGGMAVIGLPVTGGSLTF